MTTNMEKIQISSWAEFKNLVINKKMYPQWQSIGDMYYIDAADGYKLYSLKLDKDGGAEVIDFETYYKDNWNAQLEYKSPDGLHRIHTSPRPENELTYFGGAGDHSINGVGQGSKLLFKLTAADPHKEVELEFNESISVKDGIILTENAPLGSYLDLEVVHPIAGVVGAYARSIMLLGTNRIDINSEDFAAVPYGLKIRITVYNSNGTNGQDDPAAFKVCGTLEMYRTNTV